MDFLSEFVGRQDGELAKQQHQEMMFLSPETILVDANPSLMSFSNSQIAPWASIANHTISTSVLQRLFFVLEICVSLFGFVCLFSPSKPCLFVFYPSPNKP